MKQLARNKRAYAHAHGICGLSHTRQDKCLRLYGENLSRRDLVKVAQYEVLGNEAKSHVRPVRDDRKDRNARLLVSHTAQRFQHWSIVPSGADSSLKTLTQHFVLGLFHRVPSGLIFINHQQPVQS